MRFAVEAWAPEYGAPVVEEALDASEAPADITVERPANEWAPCSPPAGTAAFPSVLFVDGVRRVEANVWLAGADQVDRRGICASYAAGAVRCQAQAQAALVAVEVRRVLLTPVVDASSIVTRHATFAPRATADDDPTALSIVLQQHMGQLEGEVATQAGAEARGGDEIVVVDGPLRRGQGELGMVGYVKAHHTGYGPPVVQQVVAALGPGQRTPLLRVGAREPRYSWYLRLPGPVTHGWAGVVRLEASADRPAPDAVELADRLAVTLPRFASAPQKDPRAPQNLVPIGGLERELRHRLGDQALLFRALRQASSG